jgi:hypothetical protein
MRQAPHSFLVPNGDDVRGQTAGLLGCVVVLAALVVLGILAAAWLSMKLMVALGGTGW